MRKQFFYSFFFLQNNVALLVYVSPVFNHPSTIFFPLIRSKSLNFEIEINNLTLRVVCQFSKFTHFFPSRSKNVKFEIEIKNLT